MPNFDSPDDVLHGACLCGAVTYRAQGPLFATSHCYCTMCQRQHGSVGSYGNVRVQGFVLERGAAELTHYQRSPKGRCGFCGVCGSMLYWCGTETPERIALALGCLAPAWTGKVEHEWFVEHKPVWLPPE